ncbi:hypothetical protein ACK35P_03015 [Aeromonas veronii]|uniref:hypothetical protein n=1 Tax=Aeromonas veronii TaxID=654 RepID=UPI0010084BEE|nr:hypothetical protein [Aeromonas veronii]MCJ8234134.1 hypothetical protein [Aeromonas veronii]
MSLQEHQQEESTRYCLSALGSQIAGGLYAASILIDFRTFKLRKSCGLLLSISLVISHNDADNPIYRHRLKRSGMSEHQKDPLIQLLELSMADIEQGLTYSLSEAQRSSRSEPSNSRDLNGFFDTEPASPDFLTEREDVITVRGPD